MLFTVNESVISYYNHETSWSHSKYVFSVSVSVSFFFFPCSKGQTVRAHDLSPNINFLRGFFCVLWIDMELRPWKLLNFECQYQFAILLNQQYVFRIKFLWTCWSLGQNLNAFWPPNVRFHNQNDTNKWWYTVWPTKLLSIISMLWQSDAIFSILFIKGSFYSESAMRLSNLQISKKIFQITILSMKFG